MNRSEFMRRLEGLLADISDSEREEALQYYREYFEDAGAENEQEVLRSLGSPEQVAASIKEDINGHAEGAFTENGFQGAYNDTKAIVEYEKRQEESSYYTDKQELPAEVPEKKKMSGGMIALLIILLICAAPILIAILAVIASCIIAVFSVIFSVFIAIAVIAFAAVSFGIFAIVIGIIKMFAFPFGGLCIAGTGLVCAGMGILFGILTVWIAVTVLPAVFRSFGELVHSVFGKKRGVA